jgi:zinc protease
MLNFIIFLFVISSSSIWGSESLLTSLKRFKIGDLDVAWLEDNKFPKFTASLYFADGAISDSLPGLTQATFDQLTSGTKSKSESQLNELLDFYAINLKSAITHEYSVFTIQGLVKDHEIVSGLVCEIFNDANFPSDKFLSYKNRSKSRLKNLVSNHAALADRVFRMISFKNTTLMNPSEGTISSLDKLQESMLKNRLNQLNHTRKVLYISGPKDSLKVAQSLSEKCHWKNEYNAPKISVAKPDSQTKIILVPVSNANQAQVRIGRYLNQDEISNQYDKFHFMAGFLGGGFTSKLVQELRVKRGLTYSANAYVSLQKGYGRAGVVTFTKSETVPELISIISDVFDEISNESTIKQEEFSHQKNHQVGGYAFAFEATEALLGQIMLYDHQGRDLKDLVNFPKNISNLSTRDLSDTAVQVLPWNKLTIVVVGDRSLEKTLSRIRKVEVIQPDNFL